MSIFKRLGYQVVFCFAKKRETWNFGKCLIELDEIPILGFYVEIEGPDADSIGAVASQLNLDPTQDIGVSYVKLLSQYAVENGMDSREFFFPDDRKEA